LNNLFNVTVIEIPYYLDVEEIRIMELPDSWFEFKNYGLCQKLGDKWIQRNKTAILKVPSTIIKKEYNYLINPNQLLFETIRIHRVEDFAFNPRLNAKLNPRKQKLSTKFIWLQILLIDINQLYLF
jgi:hypothetical protein